MRRRDLARLALAGGAVLAAPAVRAQGGGAGAWPSRPIRLIVPFTPGGSTDGMARLAGQKLQERLGQTVIVENRPGGNGTVGGIAVAQSAPDGHTFCASASIQVMARWVMRNPGYDPLADLVPVARTGQGPLLLCISPTRSPASITDLVAAVKADPRAWTFGTSSLGAAGHLATVEFNRLTGLDIPIASYRGTAPAVQDLVAGNIQLMVDPMLAMVPQVRGGRVRALAISQARRSAAAQEVPSAPEAGLPGWEFFSWWGLWAPRGIPAEIAARVNAALQKGMREPEVVSRLTDMGIEAVAESPEAFAGFIQRDVARNSELLRLARFEPE
ncbi:Bug family tripartite tricarboxylate transporter substrate binding protein [Paracraurococcus ruber]|uniref:Branched-chain alpha-keto acid dehydrogenase subunit E2 n=1 Tax=Paracraurococcus ruber TaxID=77675 RepID=A0ABS1D3R8_9PROT|nr:tripartite tricarboxylate transporter substrate binding protein [Paracraurococcus ruber]MBK1660529.1 branched-chain alpha-keto acid dehydrogenase subunit E2 [Paracraurococcus ruber]TDG31215.1 tripartite tricarboxylate transporter substrate binding protein [Paracraurococcus ruber]